MAMIRHISPGLGAGALVVLALAGIGAYAATAGWGSSNDSLTSAQCSSLQSDLEAAVGKVPTDDYKTLADVGDYVAWTKDGCDSRLSASGANELLQQITDGDLPPIAPTPVGQIAIIHHQ